MTVRVELFAQLISPMATSRLLNFGRFYWSHVRVCVRYEV